VLGRLERDYPSAARCLREDLDASLAQLKLPAAHRWSVCTTNLVERSFEEERRRSKVLPRFRSERECLKLVFGVLWRASERWRAVRFSEHERKPLARYVEARRKAMQTRRRTGLFADRLGLDHGGVLGRLTVSVAFKAP